MRLGPKTQTDLGLESLGREAARVQTDGEDGRHP